MMYRWLWSVNITLLFFLMGFVNPRLQCFLWKTGCKSQRGYKSGVAGLKAVAWCYLLLGVLPCFFESFQWRWAQTCMCGVTSLLSFCSGVQTHVLILDDCSSTSCCVQSWSTLPALPFDFYLQPAEVQKHLLWKCGGGRAKKGRAP